MRTGRNLLAVALLVVAVAVTGGAALAKSEGSTGEDGASAQAAPGNDNFAAAFTISGSSSSTTGTNAAGTVETGEPTHLDIADVPAEGSTGKTVSTNGARASSPSAS
jgi:hypothetical protein